MSAHFKIRYDYQDEDFLPPKFESELPDRLCELRLKLRFWLVSKFEWLADILSLEEKQEYLFRKAAKVLSDEIDKMILADLEKSMGEIFGA